MAIIKKESSTNIIINYIIDQISTKKLLPGDRIMNERAFSEELGVSRVPLREAISALSMVGILEARQGDGTFVKQYEPRALAKIMHIYSVLDGVSMRELFEVRAILEAQTFAAAVKNASDEEIEFVGKELETFTEFSKDLGPLSGNIERGLQTYVALNRFHNAISTVAHNRFLKQIMDSMWYMAEEYHMLAINLQNDITEKLLNAYNEHCEIYDALKSRDIDRGSLLIYKHIMDEFGDIEKAQIQ